MKFKYILTTFAAAGALMLTSCEGMLDIPQHSVSPVEGYYDTDAGAEEGITAVYGMMRSLENGMCAFSQFKDFLSDDVEPEGKQKAAAHLGDRSVSVPTARTAFSCWPFVTCGRAMHPFPLSGSLSVYRSFGRFPCGQR